MFQFKVSAIIVALLFIISGCQKDNPIDPLNSGAAFHTFVLTSPDDSRLPEPMAEDRAASDEDRQMVLDALNHHHDGSPLGNPSPLWNRLTTDLGRSAKLPPPLFARAYALVHVAIYDALLAAHVTKRRDLVDNAIAAGAASRVLTYLFPDSSRLIRRVALSQMRVEHGLAKGRLLRSWILGRTVGGLAVRYGRRDGSDAVFTDTIPVGPQYWYGTNPVLPMCGTWKTWITTTGAEFQPEPPYAYGSHEDSVEVQQVYDASLVRTAEQIAVVHKWADLPPPTIWNNYLNERVMNSHMRVMASARAYAYLNAAMYDAFVSCWQCKYVYWTARPFQRTPGLVTVIPTPNFPSYTSGHSTISGTAAIVMSEVFPAEAAYFNAEADEAAISRFWGGIHFHHDDNQGLVVGRQIGEKTVALMQSHDHSVFALR